MTKKTIRQFASQFGKDWQCSCKAGFKVASLDIVSETENSLVAHYRCPECGREQMLAASISSDRDVNLDSPLVAQVQLSADDVLDIRDELKAMKLASIRALQKGTARRQRLNQPSS